MLKFYSSNCPLTFCLCLLASEFERKVELIKRLSVEDISVRAVDALDWCHECKWPVDESRLPTAQCARCKNKLNKKSCSAHASNYNARTWIVPFFQVSHQNQRVHECKRNHRNQMEWLFAKWKTFETSRNAHFKVQNKRQSSVCCFCVKGKSWGIAREKLNISAKRNVQCLVRIVKEMPNIWTLRQGEIQCSMFVWRWNAKHLNTVPPPPPAQREPVSSFAPAPQTEYVIIIKASSSPCW